MEGQEEGQGLAPQIFALGKVRTGLQGLDFCSTSPLVSYILFVCFPLTRPQNHHEQFSVDNVGKDEQ